METRLKRLYLTSWVGGSTHDTLFVSRLQSQGSVWTPDFFVSGDLTKIWQKLCWIRIVDDTFKIIALGPSVFVSSSYWKISCAKFRLLQRLFHMPDTYNKHLCKYKYQIELGISKNPVLKDLDLGQGQKWLMFTLFYLLCDIGSQRTQRFYLSHYWIGDNCCAIGLQWRWLC